MTEKDYYELLEVSRDADGETIKKSYRRLAMKYHPDRNPGDKEAETKFKEINEAYDVLKDSQKRAAYDRYGHQAFAGGAGGNPFNGFEFNFGSGGFSDIFADVFSEFMGGGRRGGQRSYAQRGEDVRYNLSISLEEAFSGVEKEITIPSTETCEDCHGHGTKDGSEAPICDKCGGSGRIHQQQGGFFIQNHIGVVADAARNGKQVFKLCQAAVTCADINCIFGYSLNALHEYSSVSVEIVKNILND